MTEPEQSPGPVEGMITISVHYYNMLRRRTGVEQETITLTEGISIRATLEHLANRYGPYLREMLFAPEGSVASHLVIFRNQKLMSQDQYLLSLADSDELMLFLAIAGG